MLAIIDTVFWVSIKILGIMGAVLGVSILVVAVILISKFLGPQ